MKSNKYKYLFFSFIIILCTFFFNNCSETSTPEQQNMTSTSIACDQVDSTLTTPNSISQAIDLINALPKPLTIDCLLISLKKPLKVMAINNTFSAQPAVGNDNPRIFIVNTKLSISVAPAGTGRYLVEMSEPTNSTMSFKAEIAFPVTANIDTFEALSSITDKSTGTSRCISCHKPEERLLYANSGYGFISNIVRPNEYQRVFSSYMKNQAMNCDPKINKYRCDILKAIYVDGQATDATFPF